MLSFLAHGDFNAEVTGLDKFPVEEWPPVVVTHIAFQIMVGCGFLLMTIGLAFLVFLWKYQHLLLHKSFLTVVALATPLGFIAVEAGWTVTEVGRQPWIMYGIMKTKDALTPMPGLIYPLLLFTALYMLLAGLVTWLMVRQIKVLHETHAPQLAAS